VQFHFQRWLDNFNTWKVGVTPCSRLVRKCCLSAPGILVVWILRHLCGLSGRVPSEPVDSFPVTCQAFPQRRPLRVHIKTIELSTRCLQRDLLPGTWIPGGFKPARSCSPRRNGILDGNEVNVLPDRSAICEPRCTDRDSRSPGAGRDGLGSICHLCYLDPPGLATPGPGSIPTAVVVELRPWRRSSIAVLSAPPSSDPCVAVETIPTVLVAAIR
jgi:hypothetical protein